MRNVDVNRLQAILDSAVAAIITIDEDGVIQEANRAVSTIFGHEPDAIVGRDVAMLMPEPWASKHAGYIWAYRQTGHARIIGIGRNVRGLRADGTTFPMHLSVGEFTDDRGRRGFTGIVSDRSALELSEMRLSEALASLHGGFALYDGEDRLVMANPAFGEIYGLPDALVQPGTRYEEQMQHALEAHGLDGPELGAELRARTERIRHPANEYREQLPDGRWFLARERRSPNGDTVAVRTDITNLISQERAYRASERMRALGELTGGAAHDFNNLLAVIVGNLELLRDGLEGEDQEMCGEALEAAEMGARLTSRLLAFARRQTLAPEAVDVNELVLDVAAILRRTVGPAIDLSLDLAPDLPPAAVDRTQLESGIVNLATNARDAMPDGGRLVIGTAAAGQDRVELSVSDDGHGMAPEVVERVFEPFFTTKPKGSGTGHGSGLGLATLYGFVQQTGGSIDVESAIGMGSTFRIRLPVAPVERDGNEPSDEEVTDEPPLSGVRVLAVEDDERVARSLVRRLRALGVAPVLASDGEHALAAALGDATPDIVFSDVAMPGGMSGWELAVRLHELRPDLPVVMTSGYADDQPGRDAARHLDLPLLHKPYRLEELKDVLLRSLGRADA